MSGFDMDSIAQAAGLRNEPVQARSTRTLDSLNAAALEVLAEYGFDEFSTALVAERARKSIGTVYRYYPDREAILDAVVPGRRQTHEVLFERIRAVAKGYTPEHDDAPDSDHLLFEADRRIRKYASIVTGERADLVAAIGLGLAALERHDRQARAAELDVSDDVDGTEQ